MGNSTSKENPDLHVNAVTPASLQDTTGETLRCEGWVVQEPVPAWSTGVATRSMDIIVPPPGPTQVRVKLYAAGVNPVDVKRPTFGTAGSALFAKPKTPQRHPLPSYPFPYVMGIEGAGVVESVGWENSTPNEATRNGTATHDFGIAVGDRVVLLADLACAYGGTFCQYALVEADAVAKIPSTSPSSENEKGVSITFTEAAAMPCAAGTAYVALFDKLAVQPTRSIFISGASGGVGSAAVQMAKYAGLYVIASCSAVNAAHVRKLGADCVLDYMQEDVVAACLARTNGFGVDYVLEVADLVGAAAHAEALRFGGAICVIPAPIPNVGEIFFRRQLTLSYVFLAGLHAHLLTRGVLRRVCEGVMELYSRGAFRLDIETVSADRADAALEVIARGHTRGKIVLIDLHKKESS